MEPTDWEQRLGHAAALSEMFRELPMKLYCTFMKIEYCRYFINGIGKGAPEGNAGTKVWPCMLYNIPDQLPCSSHCY